jgi:hypothetical protein
VGSSRCGPDHTFCISAPSATLRVIGPNDHSSFNAHTPYSGTRPRGGLKPNKPQQAAGTRTEPA